MAKVLVVATSPKTHGGIATVVKMHKSSDVWKKYKCKWIPVHRDGSKIRKLIYFAIGFMQYCCLLPFYDIVHIHMSTKISARRKIYFVKLAQLLRKKVVVHLHIGTQVEKEWSNKLNYIFSTADAGLILANNIKELVGQHTGRLDNLYTCYNPCPTIKIDSSKTRKKIILYTGYFNKEKGYDTIIKAFSRIAKKYPDWKLKMAGIGETEVAQKLIVENELESQVDLLGWIDGEKKDELYRTSSIYSFGSKMEGFPMSVLEAWAYGLPVVTTKVGGLVDVVQDGENCLLFEYGDAEQLANRFELLIGDVSLRERIAYESIRLAEGVFNIHIITQNVGELYNSLMQK